MADETENKPKQPRTIIVTQTPEKDEKPTSDLPDANIVETPKPEGRKMAKDNGETSSEESK